ncbi:MAG: hypothetical protein H0U37_02970 [Chloroflexi bacterium]|nr:hypothetical protein [Chloroflexota bacterium]
MPLMISSVTLNTAGVLLIAIVAVEWGGYYMLALARGRLAATPFQITFSRAGHAHAGVLVILALVGQLYVDAAGVSGVLGFVARDGIPLAAILMPAGFFLSSTGAGRTRPNALIWLLYAGTVSLGVGVVGLGVGLLTA